MQTIHVSRDFDVDAATIFDVIADHEGYARLPGVKSVSLRAEGSPERGGVGAERVLRLPAMTLVEEITEYKAGESLGYRIIESPLPIHHLGARVFCCKSWAPTPCAHACTGPRACEVPHRSAPTGLRWPSASRCAWPIAARWNSGRAVWAPRRGCCPLRLRAIARAGLAQRVADLGQQHLLT